MPRHTDQLPAAADPRAAAGKLRTAVPTAGWPAGVPRARVAEVARSLDFYLTLGFEVRRAADGWALLCFEPTSLVLIHATPPAPSPAALQIAASPLVRLSTPDIQALRRRLLAEGVLAGTNTQPDMPGHKIEVTDPDLHRVVISQTRPACSAPGRARWQA